jgi:hypothetical protein
MIIDLEAVLRNISAGRAFLVQVEQGKAAPLTPEIIAEAKRDLAKLDEALSLAHRIADGWVA